MTTGSWEGKTPRAGGQRKSQGCWACPPPLDPGTSCTAQSEVPRGPAPTPGQKLLGPHPHPQQHRAGSTASGSDMANAGLPSATSHSVPGQPASSVRASQDFLCGKTGPEGLEQLWPPSMRPFRDPPTPGPLCRPRPSAVLAHSRWPLVLRPLTRLPSPTPGTCTPALLTPQFARASLSFSSWVKRLENPSLPRPGQGVRPASESQGFHAKILDVWTSPFPEPRALHS